MNTAQTYNRREIASVFQIDESAVMAAVREGYIPQPIIGGSEPRWSDASITRFLNGESKTMQTIPKSQRLHRGLKAFDSVDDAYLAGQWLSATVLSRESGKKECLRRGLKVSASSDGFLVPEELSSAVIRLRERRSVFTRFANRVPMESDLTRVPRLLGGISSNWTAPKQSADDSDEQLGSATLAAKKLIAITEASSELDEDSVIDFAETIADLMAWANANKIDQAAFNGDGTSEFGGVAGLESVLHTNAVQVAATGNTAVTTLDLADFEAAAGLAGDYEVASPRWFMNRRVYFSACSRLLGGQVVVMPNDEGVMEPYFCGYPVTFVPVMTKTITASPSTVVAYFGDLRLAATFGTRNAASFQLSSTPAFERDCIKLRLRERAAIVISELGENDGNRPIVALKTSAE